MACVDLRHLCLQLLGSDQELSVAAAEIQHIPPDELLSDKVKAPLHLQVTFTPESRQLLGVGAARAEGAAKKSGLSI